MANTRSAIKRVRQTKTRTERNRQSRSRLKTQVRRLKRALETSNSAAANELLKPTISEVDKSVQSGVIKKNTASRIKSRLSRRVKALAGAKS